MIAQSRGAYIAMKLALEDRRTGRLVSTASGTVAPKGSAQSVALSKKHEAELQAYTPSLESIRAITMKTLFHKELVTEDLVKTRYEMSKGKNYDTNLKRSMDPIVRRENENLGVGDEGLRMLRQKMGGCIRIPPSPPIPLPVRVNLVPLTYVLASGVLPLEEIHKFQYRTHVQRVPSFDLTATLFFYNECSSKVIKKLIN